MKNSIINVLLYAGLSCGLQLMLVNPVNAQLPLASGAPNQALLNEPVDISEDFRNFSNTYFLADSLTAFNPETGQGESFLPDFIYSNFY